MECTINSLLFYIESKRFCSKIWTMDGYGRYIPAFQDSHIELDKKIGKANYTEVKSNSMA